MLPPEPERWPAPARLPPTGCPPARPRAARLLPAGPPGVDRPAPAYDPGVTVSIPGATHVHRGKVRDLYALADGTLLMVASDRISA